MEPAVCHRLRKAADSKNKNWNRAAAGVPVRDIGGVRVRITMWNMWISFLFQNDLNEFQ